ncbi:MAG: UPF0182 family protein [Propionibacteriaceae bacterium]|nr:UPF0182 family protein [Propionibacteriaceae bacterium]
MAETRTTHHRSRRWVLPVLVVLLVLVIAISLAVNILTEAFWYDSVAASRVYWTRLITGVLLFIVFGIVSGALVAVSMLVGVHGEPSKIVIMGVPVPRWLVVALPAVVIGVGTGWVARSAVDSALGWINQAPFGIVDPTFGKDVAFFVYSLPWWQMIASATMAVLVLTGLVQGMYYLMTAQGSPVSVRATQHDGVMTPEVKVTNPFNDKARMHLSVIVALAVADYGWICLLDRYAYVFGNNGLFTGIGYTEAHARLIARLVVAIIAFICAAVFVVNVKIQRWLLSITSLILMVLSSIIVSGVYPALVQRISVAPDEPIVQAPYIANNIEATRLAYGIDGTDITDYSAKTTTSAGQLKSDAEALPGIRLIDPYVVPPTFEQLQQVRGYYSFPSILDVDRYDLNGQTTDVIVAARELDQLGMPDQSWNNVHTVFTHGFGMVAAYGNQRQATGEPVWLEGDIPPTGSLGETQSRIYFGERSTAYAIVGAPAGSNPVELDTPGGGTGQPETRNTYDGTGGVPMGTLWRRALFTLKYGDINVLLSDRVNSESKILYDRTPTERVQKIAPWLTIDSDPYPAIVDGHLTWIVDAYTATDRYPNSQDSSLGTGNSAVTVNYVRNSVKATVDAYDGTVTLYAWDETDPILQTWMKTYPGIVQPKSAISADLMAHLRYPEDLFNTQRSILARYHITDPNTWYQQSDLWQIPSDPRTSQGQEPAYYLSIKWPGDDSPVFSQTAVYVPNGRANLGAYLSVVADARSPKYGQLRVLKLSDSQQIAGPAQTFNAISTDQGVTEKLLPYTRQNASPVFGNLLTLPLGGGLIYVMPIYTVGNQATSYPLLRFVAVRFGDKIGIGDTLQQALDSVFQGDAGANTGENPTPDTTNPPPDTNPSEPPTTTPPSSGGAAAAQQALADAQAAFSAADAALKSGDLATYQAQIAIAQQKVAEAVQDLG